MVYTSRKINRLYFKVYPILQRIEMSVAKYCDKAGKVETFRSPIRKEDIRLDVYGGKDR